MGWPIGILIDASKGIPTDNNIPSSLFIQNTIVAGCNVPVKYAPSATTPSGSTDPSITAWFNTAAYGNSIVATNNDILTAAFNYTSPDFTPVTNSTALAGASFANTGSGFTNVSYRGAVGAGDTWFKVWTKY